MHGSRRDFLRSTGRACLAAAVATLSTARALAAGAGHDKIDNPLPLSLEGLPVPQTQAAPDADLARRIKAISNVFEVGRPEADYAYVENLGDGRGYTVTQYGFCTYNTEVTQVIARYAARVPETPLKHFLPELPPRKWTHQDLSGFAAAWRHEIKTSKLLGVACDEEADLLYFQPAVEAAAAVGVKSAIGKSIFYDTLLQHGAASDADSLPSILKRTIEENGDLEDNTEVEFLRAFLGVRRSVLEEPANRETREVWRASVRRVDALLDLLDKNPNLVPPIEVANSDDDIDIVL
jgi:chitosanase